jgi:hypothetical protein
MQNTTKKGTPPIEQLQALLISSILTNNEPGMLVSYLLRYQVDKLLETPRSYLRQNIHDKLAKMCMWNNGDFKEDNI